MTKEQLNLSVCKNIKINIEIPVSIKKGNEYKHNSSSEYYNDLCFIYPTENGFDISLNDRKKEFNNNNMSLCEKKCEYEGYNSSLKKAKCQCEVKEKMNSIIDILNNKEKLFNDFPNIKNIINFDIMKCYKVLFDLSKLKKNIGNYILSPIIAINIFSAFIFLFKGYKNIYDTIKSFSFFKENNSMQNIQTQNNNIIYQNKKRKKKKKKKLQKIQINKGVINIINISGNKKNMTKDPQNNNKNKNDNNKNILENPPSKISKKKLKKSKKSRISKSRKKINYLKTKNEIDENSFSKLQNSKNKNLIQKGVEQDNNMNINNKNNQIIINKQLYKYNDYELNILDYKQALIIDKRNYIKYYFSLLRKKHLLIFTFYTSNDYNSRIIKICLFFFSFASYFTINTLFFNDDTMHEIYEYKGSYIFIYHLGQIFYSSLICNIINLIVTYFSLTEKNILSLKKSSFNMKERISSLIKCLKIKFILFFIIELLFLGFFWYYVSCFCSVYTNTQIHLIKDTFISFGLSLLYPFGICLLPGMFRIPALRAPKKNKECVYKFSKIIQMI